MTAHAMERGRDVVRWHSIDELDWASYPADARLRLTGAEGRLLSASGDGSSQTWMIRVPAGWDNLLAGAGVTELFVTEGQLEIDGLRVGVGGFVGLGEAAGSASVRSVESSVFLLFINENFDSGHCYPDPRPYVVKSRELPWEVLGERGVAVKNLRPGTAAAPESSPVGFLNLLLFLPGFVSDEVEYHNTWEEMVYLDGDFFMVERGNAGTTTYHANPAGELHGPFGSQWGSLMIHHALEPYRTEFDYRPGGLERVAAYLDTTAFDSNRPKTERWSDAPDGEPARA